MKKRLAVSGWGLDKERSWEASLLTLVQVCEPQPWVTANIPDLTNRQPPTANHFR